MEQSPFSTLSGASAETHSNGSPQGKIEMVFRFWGANGRSAETGENASIHPLGHHPGVLAMIEDAVASKRGVFVSSPEFLYVSRLERPADALVISRQVQLGLEGFRTRHGSGPVAISIAIDAGGGERPSSAEAKEPADRSLTGQDPADQASMGQSQASMGQGQEPPHDLVTLLKLSKPAQILLTHDLCRQMAALKGLPLRSFPARFGVYEYLWTAEDKLDLLQSEPQLTLTALPMAAPAKDKNGAPAATTKSFEAPATSAADTDRPSGAKRELPRAYILGGAGLAAVIVLAAIGIHLAQKPAVGPAQNATPAVNAAPIAQPAAAGPAVPAQAVPAQASPAAAVPVSPAPTKPHAGKPPAAKPIANPAQQEAKAPAAPGADCTLGADVSRYVGLAEQARGRGDYANAARIFREVLACDPNNAAAREGLAKAMQAEQQHDQ
jgi:hypothetical protein